MKKRIPYMMSGTFELTNDAPVPDPPATPAPTMLVAPTASPSSGTVGDNITLTLGTWSNGTPAGVLMQGGVNRTSEITDGVWSPGVAGSFTWTVTATGAGGSTAAPVVSGTVAAAPVVGVDYASSWLYLDGASAIVGTDSAVESVVNSGNGGYNLARVGTGADVTRSAAGFTFANARRLTATSITTAGIDGVFIMLRATISAYSGSPSYLFTANPPSGLISIYDNNGSLQARYHDGATRNIALGATPYGTEFVVGLEINNQTGAVRTYDLTGTLASLTPAGTPGVLFNTVNAGQTMTGTIHQAAIFTKPTGGAFPHTFEQVFADFLAA